MRGIWSLSSLSRPQLRSTTRNSNGILVNNWTKTKKLKRLVLHLTSICGLKVKTAQKCTTEKPPENPLLTDSSSTAPERSTMSRLDLSNPTPFTITVAAATVTNILSELLRPLFRSSSPSLVTFHFLNFLVIDMVLVFHMF
uniref:Uncharacterized protein n=1 Tax=Noccaea caerulescens TaxID=107243 RepID=A0A1J3JX74_NOCCA